MGHGDETLGKSSFFEGDKLSISLPTGGKVSVFAGREREGGGEWVPSPRP